MFKRTKDFTKISPRRHKRMLLKAAKYANMEQRKVEQLWKYTLSLKKNKNC